MGGPVGSQMALGKLLVKNVQGKRLSQTHTVPIEKAVDSKTPVEATRFALPYMFANTQVFIPGAIAAVMTAERICMDVNPELKPVIQTIIGCTNSETRQTIVIGPMSPSGRY